MARSGILFTAAIAAATASAAPGMAVAVGQADAEAASPIRLRSFGAPEVRGKRPCRNGDESGIGDGKAGYASIEVPTGVSGDLYEVLMDVWGKSDEFSFVAHNGTTYRTVGRARPSGRAEWETIRFVLRPLDLDADGTRQRFGFSSRDRQVWVSRFEFRPLASLPADHEALVRARHGAATGSLVIAAGGATDLGIVIPADSGPALKHAAAELQRYLFDMTGAYSRRIPRADVPCIRLSVETAAFANPDGFSLSTAGQSLEIVGGSPLGVLYGVYAFLEELGCRWMHPGADGDVVPKRDPLIVGPLSRREEPDFEIRWVGQGDWAIKNRCNVNVTIDGERLGIAWKWSFHSFYGLLPPDIYWEEHPEYYPLIKGKRRRPDGYSNTQLCTTNPEVIRAVADAIIAIFRDDPRLDVVALCPNDGSGFCTCPACTALDSPDADFWGRYSDRLAPFNNAVARRVATVFPKKIIKIGAYAMYMRYPSDPAYRPEPNLAVQACHTYSCNNHAIASDCERNTLYFREPLKTWARYSNHLWIYEYYIKGAWAGLLYTQHHIMASDIAYYRSLGAESFYTQWSTGAFRSVGLDFYLATRLLWDTNADMDALLRDYCLSCYREAGEPMIRFYQRLARAFAESGDCISPFGYKRVWLAAPQVFTPEVLTDLEQHLEAAGDLAPDDEVRRRLEPTRVTFGYTKRAMQYLSTVTACFAGIDAPTSPGFAAAEAKAREAGEKEAKNVIAYLKEHGRKQMARSQRGDRTSPCAHAAAHPRKSCRGEHLRPGPSSS